MGRWSCWMNARDAEGKCRQSRRAHRTVGFICRVGQAPGATFKLRKNTTDFIEYALESKHVAIPFILTIGGKTQIPTYHARLEYQVVS